MSFQIGEEVLHVFSFKDSTAVITKTALWEESYKAICYELEKPTNKLIYLTNQIVQLKLGIPKHPDVPPLFSRASKRRY